MERALQPDQLRAIDPGATTNVFGQLPALVSESRIGAGGVPSRLLGGLNRTALHTLR